MAIHPNTFAAKPGFLRELNELDRLLSQALAQRQTRDASYDLPRSILSPNMFQAIRERFLFLGWENVQLLPSEDVTTATIRFKHPRTEWERFNIGLFPHFEEVYGA